MSLVMLPIYLLLNILIKKKDLENLREKCAYDWDKVFDWNAWLMFTLLYPF
jgi:hypothetical protein